MHDLLAFAHMMKTAGTSFNKELICHLGRRMHIVPGGLKLQDDSYGKNHFLNDLKKTNNKIRLISGHPLRPYKKFGQRDKNLRWFTLFREPCSRYVSHYFHDFRNSNGFTYKRFAGMANKSIEEWEKIEKNANYQTRFIAGEPNVDKALEIIDKKMAWVGMTEYYEKALKSFSVFFNLRGFKWENRKTNVNGVPSSGAIQVHEKFQDFILEKNILDIKLYEHVKNEFWPKFKLSGDEKIMSEISLADRVVRKYRFYEFACYRHMVFKPEKFTMNNLARWRRRWLQ